ncbi:MAG: hypothetical protein QMB42_02120 [SAR324 cluster bacterium]|jgi:hypothetical protein
MDVKETPFVLIARVKVKPGKEKDVDLATFKYLFETSIEIK